MILADTSLWIQFLRANQLFYIAFRQELERGNVIGVECVFGELLQGAKAQREIKIIQEYWGSLPKKDETGLWLEAGFFSSKERWFSKGVGLIDAFLICFAKKYQLKIWTLDKKLSSVLSPELRFSGAFLDVACGKIHP